MATNRMQQLEAKLTLQQRKAALILVENELSGEAKKTREEIAAEVGIERTALWRWNTRNQAFIEYKNALADDMLSTHRVDVYAQLMKLISGSQPSVKAIDLFMKRFGLLTERQITQTDNTNDNRGNTDIEKELAELDELINDEGGEN